MQHKHAKRLKKVIFNKKTYEKNRIILNSFN